MDVARAAMTCDAPLESACLKIVMLIVASISVHLSLSPPNPPAPTKQCVAPKKSLFERSVRWVTFCSKALVWLAAMSDVVATASAYLDISRTLPYLFSLVWTDSPVYNIVNASHPRAFNGFDNSLLTESHPRPSCPIFTASPLFVLGVILVVSGAILRWWCFRTLGRFFTFELSIDPSHALITVGPYSYVRHPSYTGIYLTLLGGTLVGLSPGTWLYERWFNVGAISHEIIGLFSRMKSFEAFEGPFLESWTSVSPSTITSFGRLEPVSILIYTLVSFWLVKVWYALRSTNHRVQIEDAELRRVFRDVWEEYARKVRWRLVPGIY